MINTNDLYCNNSSNHETSFFMRRKIPWIFMFCISLALVADLYVQVCGLVFQYLYLLSWGFMCRLPLFALNRCCLIDRCGSTDVETRCTYWDGPTRAVMFPLWIWNESVQVWFKCGLSALFQRLWIKYCINHLVITTILHIVPHLQRLKTNWKN